jgi:hypothetical protein
MVAGKIGITLTFGATHCADKSPMLGHLGVDHIVPELQLVERFHRLMMAAETKAMHSEGRLAARSSMGNGLCWLATCHPLKVAVSWAISLSAQFRLSPDRYVFPGPLVAYAVASLLSSAPITFQAARLHPALPACARR